MNCFFLQEDKNNLQKPILEKKKWIHDPSSKSNLLLTLVNLVLYIIRFESSKFKIVFSRQQLYTIFCVYEN